MPHKQGEIGNQIPLNNDLNYMLVSFVCKKSSLKITSIPAYMNISLYSMQLWMGTIYIHETRLLLYVLLFVNKQFMHLNTGENVSGSYRFIRSWLSKKLSKLCIRIFFSLAYSYMSVKRSYIVWCALG